MSKEYDFIVGFTLFTPKGFRTMYRHFDNLEIAEMFASNVNIKDNHKIYVDLDLYNKEKQKNEENIQALEEWINGERVSVNCISKDKIREKLKECESRKFSDFTYEPNFAVEKVLKELLEND